MDNKESHTLAKKCIADLGFEKIAPDITENIIAATIRWMYANTHLWKI